MVARLEAADPGADLADDAGTLMPQDRREHAFRISARQGKCIGVADAGGHDLNQHLASARAVEIDLHDFKGLAGFNGNCGTGLHDLPPSPADPGQLCYYPRSRWHVGPACTS